jgi:YHS domain-containing protein
MLQRFALQMVQLQLLASLFLLLLLLTIASLPAALAQQGGGNSIPGPDAPVLAGYDLVEYHNLQPDQDGVLGKASISHRLETNGYLYYFATEENRELFKQNPEKYLPKYGGFCAWGLAWEYEDEGWPWAANHVGPPCGPADGWAILPSDGKLYCSIYRHYQDDFNSKQDEGIRLADERWIAWYGSLSAGPQNNGCYAWNWQECFARSIHASLEKTSTTADEDNF